jgi:hypothetical protein
MGNKQVAPIQSEFNLDNNAIIWETPDENPLIRRISTHRNSRHSVKNSLFFLKEFQHSRLVDMTFMADEFENYKFQFINKHHFPFTKKELKSFFKSIQNECMEEFSNRFTQTVFWQNADAESTFSFIFKNEIKKPLTGFNKKDLVLKVDQNIKTFVMDLDDVSNFDLVRSKQLLNEHFPKYRHDALTFYLRNSGSDNSLNDNEKVYMKTPNIQKTRKSVYSKSQESKANDNSNPNSQNKIGTYSDFEIYADLKRLFPTICELIVFYAEKIDSYYDLFDGSEYKVFKKHVLEHLKYCVYLKMKSLQISGLYELEIRQKITQIDHMIPIDLLPPKFDNPYTNDNLKVTTSKLKSSAANALRNLVIEEDIINFGPEKIIKEKLINSLRGFFYRFHGFNSSDSYLKDKVKDQTNRLLNKCEPFFSFRVFKEAIGRHFFAKDEFRRHIYEFLLGFMCSCANELNFKHKFIKDMYFDNLKVFKPLLRKLLKTKNVEILNQVTFLSDILELKKVKSLMDLARTEFSRVILDMTQSPKLRVDAIIFLFVNLFAWINFMPVEINDVDFDNKVVNIYTCKVFAFNQYTSFFKAALDTFAQRLCGFRFGFSGPALITAIEQAFEQKLPTESDHRLFVNYTEAFVRVQDAKRLRQLILAQRLILQEYIVKSFERNHTPIGWNINKLFVNKSFIDNFFSFEKMTGGEDSRKSKHIVLMIGGVGKAQLGYGHTECLSKIASGLGSAEIYQFKYQFKNNKDFIAMQNFESLDLLGFSNIPRNYFELLEALGKQPSEKEIRAFNEFAQSGRSMRRKKTTHHAKTSSSKRNEWVHYCRIAGKCLAAMISNTNLFGHCNISLVGLSFGAVVAWHCYNDLFKLGKTDRIYDLAFIGAPLCLYEIDTLAIANLSGSLYNVFSADDWILKIVTSNMPNVRHCIGNDKLKFDKPELHRKYFNLDLSELVCDHKDYGNEAERIVSFIRHEKAFKFFMDEIKKNAEKPKEVVKETNRTLLEEISSEEEENASGSFYRTSRKVFKGNQGPKVQILSAK